jgi:hypothetical protein
MYKVGTLYHEIFWENMAYFGVSFLSGVLVGWRFSLAGV